MTASSLYDFTNPLDSELMSHKAAITTTPESKKMMTRIERKRCPELQIRGGIEDKSKKFSLFLNENVCCDPSLEPSQQDGSNDGSQHTF